MPDIDTSGRANALPRLIPERLREAREARGLTGEQLAEQIGVTRQAIAQYESGQRVPLPEIFSKIIGVTRQPPTFFLMPRRRQTEVTTAPFWRSLKRMDHTARLRVARQLEWALDIVDYVESFIELPKVNIPVLDWDYETGDGEDIEAAALSLRHTWGIGYGPVLDVPTLLEANGVVLIRQPVGCEDMDAVSRWQNGRPYILYSAEVESYPRVNYNLAHELGHVVLHGGLDITSHNLAKIERQANRFAGAFLLPRNSFPQEVISTSISYFRVLKERWQISISAMVYRCKDLQILNEHQVKYLWRQMNLMGIRQVEPLDNVFEHIKPSLIVSALEMLVFHKVQSKGDIERAINLNPADIESLASTDPGWLSADKVVQLMSRPRLRSNDRA
jgi:Zn-dependent peptidase ImmA (M78 family)/transcriptional regulator with XRE-family HTH domain